MRQVHLAVGNLQESDLMIERRKKKRKKKRKMRRTRRTKRV